MMAKSRTFGGYRKEKTKSAMKRSKGISPVIATVILIAVAVAIGLAVAFWASGLTGTLTRYEKLEIRTAYAVWDTDSWDVTLIVNNTGSVDSTITQITINGKPYVIYTTDTTPSITITGTVTTIPYTIPTGRGAEVIVTIPQASQAGSSGFTNGQTIEVALITATGTPFPKAVVLP